MSSNLLQETVLRAAHQHDQTNAGLNNDLLLSPSKSHRTHVSANSSADNSDNEDMTIIRVHTPAPFRSPNSANDTPVSSRPGSPSRAPHHPSSPNSNQSRGNSRVGARAKREAAAKAKASSADPLLRFPKQISVRILELVGLGSDGSGGSEGDIFSGVRDLMACGLACHKWRDSATINFIWFKLCSSVSYASSLEEAFEPPTWTRKDSKIDWATRYRIKNRPLDRVPEFESYNLEPKSPTVSQMKHLQWEEEEEAKDGGQFASKAEARAFYKELGGRKLKNKTGKGSANDRTGWETLDLHQ